MEEAFYEEYARIEDQHWWFVGRRKIFLAMLDRYFGRDGPHARRILDVGCGSGTMLGYLERYGAAEGVDSSEEAISFCRARGVERVQHADGLPLPFPGSTFDLVTALDMLEHVDDDEGLLRELRRVTKPGGMLMLSVPAYRFLWGRQDEVSQHRRRYVARSLRERVRNGGWSIRRLTYFNTLFFPVIAAIRLMRPRRTRGELKSDFSMTGPGRLNSALGRVFGLEAPLLERVDLPFGVSILVLAANEGDET